MTLRLGVFASHRGSNMQTVVRAADEGRLDAEIALVVSNNSQSGALEFARANGLAWRHLSGKTHPEVVDLDAAILDALREHGVEVVLLLGYMKLLGPRTVDAYRGRILNIHPALLPRHGGKGMYGLRVHQAVLDAGDAETGVTTHLADEIYDHGDIVAQARVPVEPGDTAETLAERVLVREHAFLVETLQRIATGELSLG